MSDKLQTFKQENPDYMNVPNGQLAFGLWNQSYKGSLPMGRYADMIGLSSDDFKDMVNYAEQTGYKPTESAYAQGFIPEGARAATAARGMSLGAAENIGAALAAGGEKVKRFVTGEEQRPYGEAFQDYLGLTRDIIGQYQQEKPVESFFMEAVPAVASGVGIERAIATGAPKAIAAMSPATKVNLGTSPSIAKTAAASGVSGGVYGYTTGETGERAQSAFELAIPSALFGGGSQVALNFAAPAIRSLGKNLGRRFQQMDRKPTVDAARRLKNDAYKAATDAGVVYDAKTLNSLYNEAKRMVVDSASYDPLVDDQLSASLRLLKDKAKRPSNLIQLEKVRRALFDRFKKSGYADQNIRDLVDLVDETIQTGGSGDGTLIKAARLANSRYKKAELIDEAFDKASRSGEVTGSGGNTVNRYKQVVNNLLNDKKAMRFFDDSEQEAMRNFIEFSTQEQITRLVGKLDPTSSGLMLALGGAATYAVPTAAIPTAIVGAAARRGLEQTTEEAGQALTTRMATGRTPMVAPTTVPSATGQQILSAYERELENMRGNR